MFEDSLIESGGRLKTKRGLTTFLSFGLQIALVGVLVLIPLLSVVLLVGTFAPHFALFKQIYFKVLKPRGVVKPRPVQDRPEPHNFAQGMGGVVLAIASLLLVPLTVAGLALSLLVAILAFINLAFGYCLGCQIYYQLGRAGLVKATR